MTRRTTKQETNKTAEELLIEKVEKLSALKPQYDALKKTVEALTSEIKEEMKNLGAEEVDLGHFTATLGTATSRSFDSPKLMVWAKEQGFNDVIKLVETLDEDVLEDYTYNGIIAPRDLEPFLVEKVTYRLTTKVPKE